jgi:outer membrane immunogenic protein
MTYGKGIAIIGVAVALAAIAFPAIAADLVRYPTPVPRFEQPAPLGTSWSGFYIGGNLGAAFDTNSSDDDAQFIGGVHTGYNWQMGSWLVGVEGDVDFSDNINFLASARGRLGWALGDWLLYGTAGVAFIDTDNNFVVVSADDGPFGFSHSNNDTGL